MTDQQDEKTYLACEECGCTDTQVSSWVDVNTGRIEGDEGHSWCPQCDEGKVEWKEVTKLQPYNPDLDI